MDNFEDFQNWVRGHGQWYNKKGIVIRNTHAKYELHYRRIKMLWSMENCFNLKTKITVKVKGSN